MENHEGKGKEKGKDKDKGKDKGKGKGKADNPHANHFYIDGKVYDFSDWKWIHPGGFAFFNQSAQRDISAAIHSYHKDPDRILPILEKYEAKLEDGKDPRDILLKGMNVPEFIVPPDFDARRDVPIYDWDKPFMKSLRKKILAPDMQKKIRNADYAFDVAAACITVFHLFICWVAVYCDILPGWLLVFLQVVTRTSLAGVGHYGCHRKKTGQTFDINVLFDIQYVGASAVLTDGHVMVHHMYTETPADVKRTVFNFMLTLPRLLRVPLFTLQKFGEFLTGHYLAFCALFPFLGFPAEFTKIRQNMRFYMLAEFFWAALCSKLHLWIAQFFFTTWVNMFQIVSSHDFEVVREQQEYKGLDWGVFQVQHSLDTYITGNPYVDIFLSAGLGCHRTHHVLPYQKSGFANIVSTPALQETCKEFGVEWQPPRNLLLDRFFPLMWYYLTAPAQLPAVPAPVLVGGPGLGGFVKEHLQIELLRKSMRDVLRGFSGASI